VVECLVETSRKSGFVLFACVDTPDLVYSGGELDSAVHSSTVTKTERSSRENVFGPLGVW
jgi:hypothetical protein